MLTIKCTYSWRNVMLHGAAVVAFIAGFAEPTFIDAAETSEVYAPASITPEMTADWWQWALSIPTSAHPLRTDVGTVPGQVDPSSSYCMVGQHGPIWFLGGSFLQVDIATGAHAASQSRRMNTPPDITRTCEIPYGTVILTPVLNGECNTAEEIYLGNLTGDETLRGRTSYLRTCASTLADAIGTARASLSPQGGRPTALEVHRVRTPLPFSMSYAPDHILQFGTPWTPTVNPSLAFADGYWALIRPLQPGNYEINTYGDVPAFGFSLRIRYIIKIVGLQKQ